jgi:tetratricopeptide (TPR) repeat protein
MAPPEDARDSGARAAKGPRIVVVPFGVSEGEFEGFGTALAALIHGFVVVDGESPALARVYATRLAPPDGERAPSSSSSSSSSTSSSRPPASGLDDDEESDGASDTARETGTKTDASGPSSKVPKVLEAELAPWHWSKVAPPGGEQVDRVITGYLEPPLAGRGMVRVTVFDPTTERVIATAEEDCDEDDCGTAIADVLAKVLPGQNQSENPLADLRGLPWEALAEVLRAEKLLLPEANLPENEAESSRRLSAALLYLGRAVSEAPEAPFPARRLAAVVSSVLAQARQGRPDPATVAAARRAILRATQDAPKRPEPAEVAVVAALSEGDLVGAEARALTGLALFPQNPRFPRFLVEIRRERGDHAGAREALDAAAREPHFATDLGLAFEAARLALAEGDFATARRLAAEIATAAPGDVAGPLLLADVIDGIASGDAPASLQSGLAEDLEAYAEAAIASGIPVLLRRAIVLLLTRGVAGAARGALLETLASRYILEVPKDPEGYLVVAKAGREAGDRSAVDEAVVALQKLAPGTPLVAEALVEQFGVHAEEAATTLDRIAETASNPELAPGDLEALQLQALHLAQEFSAWPAYHLAGLLAARIGLVDRALAAFDAGLALAPGALPLLGAQSRFTLQQLELEQESHTAREPASGELVTKARAAIETLTRLFAEDAGVATLRARLALATGDFEAVATHVAAARALEADVTLGKALEAYLRSSEGADEPATLEAAPTLLARIKGWFS